jgi:hypothetical protein
VPSFSTSLVFVAIAAAVPAVLLVIWVGLLFHRVLNLPADQQGHGATVLKQLTELVRVAVTRNDTNSKTLRRRQLRPGSHDDGGS